VTAETAKASPSANVGGSLVIMQNLALAIFPRASPSIVAAFLVSQLEDGVRVVPAPEAPGKLSGCHQP